MCVYVPLIPITASTFGTKSMPILRRCGKQACTYSYVLQCVAVCCSALQCIALCCVFVCVPRTHFAQLFTPISYLVGDAATSHVRTTNHEHDEIPSNGTHIAVCCSELQCVAVCCNVLQWVAMFCRHDEIPSDVTHIAVCCSMLQCVAVGCSGLQWAMVCWVVLQCVEVGCSVLQCVAVCCGVLQI